MVRLEMDGVEYELLEVTRGKVGCWWKRIRGFPALFVFGCVFRIGLEVKGLVRFCLT